MKLEERQKALLRLVGEYREHECRRLLDAARTEATEILGATYRKQRALLHRRIVAERSRAQARIQAARAEQATRERWRNERADFELLTVAWPLLRSRLAEVWSDARGRQAWTSRFVQQGLDLLPRGRWKVRHAAGWSESERRELAQDLTERLGQTAGFETDGGIEAGLVIACEGAMLDASLDGLLRDRDQLEARLLALLEEPRANASPHP